MAVYPRIFRIRQRFPRPQIEDVAAAVRQQLASLQLGAKIKAGETIAITAGSRGITGIDVILRAAADYLAGIGAAPFIVPAMGSHGGATAEGQTAVLESLGITDESVGCPIRASMETVVLAEDPHGFPIHFDRIAHEADHVLVCGRVKPHTMFAGPLQSGLIKMLLIGLGKHAGAEMFHRACVDFGFDEIARTAASAILEKSNIVAGLAIVENAYGDTAQITAAAPDEFVAKQEELLVLATQWMAKLPFDAADILLVDEIGKHISGTGMDTNVVGRKFSDHEAVEGETPKIRRIMVRNVLHGNATGIGLAEFCTRRAVEQTNMAATRVNCLTANHVSAAMLPIDFSTDREALDAALTTVGLVEPASARVMWIKNTKQIEQLACSVAYLDEARQRDDLEILGDPEDMPFDERGNLPN